MVGLICRVLQARSINDFDSRQAELISNTSSLNVRDCILSQKCSIPFLIACHRVTCQSADRHPPSKHPPNMKIPSPRPPPLRLLISRRNPRHLVTVQPTPASSSTIHPVTLVTTTPLNLPDYLSQSSYIATDVLSTLCHLARADTRSSILDLVEETADEAAEISVVGTGGVCDCTSVGASSVSIRYLKIADLSSTCTCGGRIGCSTTRDAEEDLKESLGLFMCCGACLAVGLTGASCTLVFVCSHDAIGSGTVVVRAAGVLYSMVVGMTVTVTVGR